MPHVLARLLASPIDARPIESLAEWQSRFAAASEGFEAPADRALIAGFAADRIAYAFAGGYQAALAALCRGKLDPARASRATSLCITEEGGGHPRAVKTALRPLPDGRFSVSGRKQWATGAPMAEVLLVAASTGTDDAGRNRLALVAIDARAPGVTLEKMPDPPFAPELPHAIVKLDGVVVEASDVLPGDGYEAYVKPFRTIEDAHVFLALVGHVIRGARAHGVAPERDSAGPGSPLHESTQGTAPERDSAGPGSPLHESTQGTAPTRDSTGSGSPVQGLTRAFVELATAVALALRQVAEMDPSAPETHVALAGALELGRKLVSDADAVWKGAPPEVRARWERDRALAMVAERARAERRSRAWERLAGAR